MKQLFDSQLSYFLRFIRKRACHGNTNFTILPKDVDNKQLQYIRQKSYFPEHQLDWEYDYFYFEINFAFASLQKQNPKRMIRFSMRVGGNFLIKDSLERVAHHLQMDRRINVKLKRVQQLLTDSSIAILGLDPDAFTTGVIMTITKKVFDQCESEMYGKKVRKEKLIYDIEAGNPFGMPWVEKKKARSEKIMVGDASSSR